MLRLFDQVQRAAPLESPVLVHGPTGAGKEHVAEALHTMSGRRGRFVAVNVASLPEAIADSELFGAVRGAYTGATADRGGLVASAANGTLFLDEAADLPIAVQVKLLRLLDSGVCRAVGATTARPVNFRLVLSAQLPSRDLLGTGRWRPDFYYRAAGLLLRVPPLRERVSDVPALVNHLLDHAGRPRFEPQACAPLMSHPWPGNVRQLKRAVERAIFDACGGPVTIEAIVSAADDAGSRDVSPDTPPPGRRAASLREVERGHIESVLLSTDGDARTAAGILGLSRSQLYRRLQALGRGRIME